VGVLYILDEPSIGLHQRDNDRLLTTLKGLRDLGNSVLVVEHDADTIRAADYILDLGPGAGVRGGGSAPVAGMIYRSGNELIAGASRARNRALDELPLPSYHLIDWARYSTARIITTRGCSYRCSFCDVTALWGNRSVYRGLDATVAEIELLRDRFGKRYIGIVDDTFVLNRERVREFCKLLIERRVGIQWGCFGRINLMTPRLAELMARAGCRAVFYGIDSGSQPVLDRTVKKVDAEDILPVVRMSKEYFDCIEASFIWGYPFETLSDFRKTLEIAAEAAMLAPTVNVLAPHTN
jgi:radical SAM superfamily enzyme YgiQ (UPF0313 family)